MREKQEHSVKFTVAIDLIQGKIDSFTKGASISEFEDFLTEFY